MPPDPPESSHLHRSLMPPFSKILDPPLRSTYNTFNSLSDWILNTLIIVGHSSCWAWLNTVEHDCTDKNVSNQCPIERALAHAPHTVCRNPVVNKYETVSTCKECKLFQWIYLFIPLFYIHFILGFYHQPSSVSFVTNGYGWNWM